MDDRDDRTVESEKRTYEEPTLVECEELLQISEGGPVGVSETLID